MNQHLSYLLLGMLCLFAACSPQKEELVISQELNDNWQFAEKGSQNWLPAQVPGCVHTDLLANEKIEDPFYRLNERKLQWIDKKDWIYRTTISADAALLARDRIALDFKGLDTYADVRINGEDVISTDNMFREYLVDIKPMHRLSFAVRHLRALHTFIVHWYCASCRTG